MSTEYQQEKVVPSQFFSPLSNWVNLGGNVFGDSLAAPILNGDGLYAFVQNSTNTLDVCQVNLTGTTGTWETLKLPVTSSPSATLARDSGVLGVICMQTSQAIDVHYIDPSKKYEVKTSHLNRVGLDSGVAFKGQVKIVRNNNNALEVFALDRGGNMWHRVETGSSVIPGEWNKGWEKLGSGFDVDVKKFDVIRVKGTQVSTLLQIVALKADHNVYQATQVEGNPGKYGTFSIVGGGSTFTFSGSPAATYGPASKSTVYAAFSTNQLGGPNPLTYFVSVGANPDWAALADTAPYAFVSDSIGLAATSDNRTHLVWMDDNLQVYMASRANGGTSYWSLPPDSVGQPGSSFNGAISLVPNDNAVSLFQSDGNNNLWFINFLQK